MSVARNSPTCGVCGSKLVRNGVTSAGRTRWRCKSCGASSTLSRPDITRKAQLRMFHDWVLGGVPQDQMASSARTFRRDTAWCWRIEVPPPTPAATAPDVVILDGTYFQSWCLLIATNSAEVIDWQWCNREKKIAWQQILQRQPAPKMVVIDGGTGLHAALKDTWPTTRIQRCYFHIYQNVRRHLTLKPRLLAGQEILFLTKALMKVADQDQAIAWLLEYNEWEMRWDGFLKQKTYARPDITRPTNIPKDRAWWYTHQALRKTRGLFRHLLRTSSLFTWLDPELIAQCPDTDPLPKTTSSLEGGPNSGVKGLLRVHRGLPVEHARRAVEWKLNSLTTQPRDPWSLVRPEHHGPPKKPLAADDHDEPIGPTLGTGFTWEDGNGIQHGWAGRSRP